MSITVNNIIKSSVAVSILALSFATNTNASIINYTGVVESWTVGTTGTYSITAIGAQGASGSFLYSGGRGASVTALFDLIAGDIYSFAVGGQGVGSENNTGSGGGGGGSFFVGVNDIPLLVAGGGGGTRSFVDQNGCDASTSQYGTIGSGYLTTNSCVEKTSALGLGGIVSSSSWGSGGAGFYGSGANDNTYGTGGGDWAAGLIGGTIGTAPLSSSGYGGFGGGGAGAGYNGGGGGGGYSGGDGGRVAGGGGSYSTGLSTAYASGVGYGNGLITWDLVSVSSPVSEPSILALLGLGLFGLSLSRRKMKKQSI